MPNLSKKVDPSIVDKFPNEARVTQGTPVEVHENNHFKDHDLEIVRKKYVRFSILMELVNDDLELQKTATVEQFAHRIRDLVQAQQRES